MLGLAIASYRWIETPLRKGNWFRKRWTTIAVGGGIMVTLSGCLGLLSGQWIGIFYSGRKAEDFDYITHKPIDFKGDFTKRFAKHCHSSASKKHDALLGALEITNEFMGNCLSAQSTKPLVAFSGDSHSLSAFPISELIASKLEFDVFSHSRDGCAFPAQGVSREGCFEVQSSVAETLINEMSKRKHGSVFVASSYLNSHFGYKGKHRRQFKKHSDGSRIAVEKNLDEFVSASKALADRLKDVGASLILVAPLPQHPLFKIELCTRQWFRPSPSGSCLKTEKRFLVKERQHIVKKLVLASREKSNLYIFDPFQKFCGKNYCYSKRGNSFLFVDYHHLSKEGALLISEDLLSMIADINTKNE